MSTLSDKSIKYRLFEYEDLFKSLDYPIVCTYFAHIYRDGTKGDYILILASKVNKRIKYGFLKINYDSNCNILSAIKQSPIVVDEMESFIKKLRSDIMWLSKEKLLNFVYSDECTQNYIGYDSNGLGDTVEHYIKEYKR